MNIGIIGLDFVPGGTGGTETYFRNLLDALQRTDSQNRYTILVRSEFAGELNLTAANFQIVPVSAGRRLTAKVWRKLRGGRSHPLAAFIDRYGFDLVHFPFQILNPWGVTTPKILTFHDMQQEFWPQFFSAEDLEGRRRTFRPSAEAADHIITISEYSKQTLVDRYRIPPAKITAIHSSYNEALFNGRPHSSELELPERYFYYPAATWPHKNHGRLLEAFAMIHRSHPEYKLVLSGIRGPKTAEIQQQIQSLGLADSIQMLGYIPYQQLPVVFERAFALVFPSLFEGFGIPLCEAMASGCPVLAANTTSLPEIGGAAARYFDPLQPAAIAEQMIYLIEQPAARQRMVAAGRRRVRRFTSQDLAEATLKVYRKVYDEKAA